jgi:superfamily II DNA or RNA helicase
VLYDQLWPYQKKAHDFALNAPGNHAALFCEQGTGKTWIASALAESIYELSLHNDYQFSGLIVAPLSTIQAHDGWRFVLAKTSLKIYQDFDAFKKSKKPKILLINWESISTRYVKKKVRVKGKLKKVRRVTPASKKRARFITSHPWSFSCFDESQKMKARNSKQSKLAGRMKKPHFRLLLSGTPFDKVLDNPQEVWAQWRYLNRKLFGTVWKDFDGDYLKRTGWMGKQRVFRTKKLKDKVFSMIKPNCLRVTKEVLGLEPPKYIWCGVSMLGRQRRLYDEMDEHSVIAEPDLEVTAELEIVKYIRLQQITGGHVKDDEGEIHDIGRAKLRKLKSLLKIVDYPVIIYARYIYEVLQVAEEVSSGNVNVATIIGKTRRTRGKTIKDFQAGKIDILVAQIKTGGVGINLQRSHNAIIYSPTFSWIDFDQAVSRLHRAGQKFLVKIFLLFCNFSIDKKIYKVIISKRNVNERVLRLFTTRPKPKGDLMAKKKAKAEGKSEKKEKKAKQETKKYTISDLAEEMEVEPASARVQLRKHGIEKVGGRYGWDTEKEMLAVAKQLKKKASKKAKDDEEEDEDEDE